MPRRLRDRPVRIEGGLGAETAVKSKPRLMPDPQEAGPSRRTDAASKKSAPAPRRSVSESRTPQRPVSEYERMRAPRSHSEHRVAPGVRVLQEIRQLQNTTGLLVPKLPFARVIREVLQQYAPNRDLRISMDALMALQESAETYMVQLFEDAYRCTLHRERVTLGPKDLGLALYLRQRFY
ncbi:histone H3-5-like [Topomyia yanbarensis]|uniref:histone H3-5-like n=1 Tax=Topomyia yanbarensis TaxID=2498891 RepID=UPI00273C827E|nr:histone H3-5-like [Topomyia yanbarensis]